MKKVLVVDDEPLIANGISELIARFDLAIEVLPPVLDSEEALLLCQKTAIDIIVTDINMPGLNGLDLIEALQETNQTTQIIILTGFGSFSYAKKAMSLGVKFFLEKPVDPSAMKEALQNCIEQCDRYTVERNFYKRQQIEQFIVNRSLTPLPKMNFPLCLYLFDSKFYPQIMEGVKSYSHQERLTVGHLNKVGYLINEDELPTFHNYFQERLHNHPLKKGVAIDCTVSDPSEFLTKFYLGKNNLDKDFYFDTFQIIQEKDIGQENNYENQLYLDFSQRLLQAIDQGELTRATLAAENFFSACRKNLYPVQLLRLQIIELLTLFFEKYEIKQDQVIEDYSPKIMLLNDWKELQFILFHTIDQLKNSLSNSENLHLSQKVNLIIEEYYNQESLSLKWIATNLLYLNSEYLGKTYYSETGIRFNQKLASYRIHRAKELLCKNYKVYEVAAMVGFGSAPEYFVQTFKKNTGQTPKQYVRTASKTN